MNENMKELMLEDENEDIVIANEEGKKPNKKFRKKIKISPFLFFSLAGAISVFLLFNLVLMPLIERKYSSPIVNNVGAVRVGTEEKHFNKGETQTQFTARKIDISTTGTTNGNGTGTNTGSTTPVNNTGRVPPVVVTPVKEVDRPNPFD